MNRFALLSCLLSLWITSTGHTQPVYPSLSALGRTPGYDNGPFHNYNVSNVAASSLTDAFTAPRSSESLSVSHSSMIATAIGSRADVNHYGDGFVVLRSYSVFTAIPVDPALANANCVLRITYHITTRVTSDTGGMFPYAYASFGDGTEMNFNQQSGNAISDFNFVLGLNANFNASVNSPLNVTAYTSMNTVGANDATIGTSHISVSRGIMEAWVNGAAVAATVNSTGGTSGTFPVPAGGSYDGITINNDSLGGNNTQVKLGGTASAATTVNVTGVAPIGGINAVSDVIRIEGTGHDLHLVQLSYNSVEAVSLFGTDTTLILGTLDADGKPKNAVLFDIDGGANSQFSFGPAPVNGVLGQYGLDRVNHTAWAWVDHNSDYVVFAPAPEPTMLAVLAIGGVMAVRRFRRPAAISAALSA